MLFRRMLADGGCALQMRRSAAEGRGDPRGGCGAGATPVVYSAMYVGAGALVATFVALRRTPGLTVPRVRKRNRCSVRSGADVEGFVVWSVLAERGMHERAAFSDMDER